MFSSFKSNTIHPCHNAWKFQGYFQLVLTFPQSHIISITNYIFFLWDNVPICPFPKAGPNALGWPHGSSNFLTFRNICCLHHSFENVIIPCLSLIQAQKFEIKFTALFFLFSTSITKSLLSSSPSLPASLELSHLSFCCVLVLSHVQLFYPINWSPPGFSVHGIFQARILEGLPFPPPGDLPNPDIKSESPVSPALQVGSFTAKPLSKPHDRG